jgi:hypothetical protein
MEVVPTRSSPSREGTILGVSYGWRLFCVDSPDSQSRNMTRESSQMAIMPQIPAVVFLLVGIGSTILILIEMFHDEIWKGFAGLLYGFYLLYYAFFDFEYENKWLIIACSTGGSATFHGLLLLSRVMD